jgi:hypothetical protein
MPPGIYTVSGSLNGEGDYAIAAYMFPTSTATSTSTILYALSSPSFSTQGSWNPSGSNQQTNPQDTLALDGVYGYMSTYDAWIAQDEGATWVWDFGSNLTGTFTAVWYGQATADSGGYCTNFSINWYASPDGSTWTNFASYTFTGTGSYGSSSAPISSSITGTYRYIKVVQYSTTSCMVNEGYTYVDSVYET